MVWKGNEISLYSMFILIWFCRTQVYVYTVKYRVTQKKGTFEKPNKN